VIIIVSLVIDVINVVTFAVVDAVVVFVVVAGGGSVSAVVLSLCGVYHVNVPYYAADVLEPLNLL